MARKHPILNTLLLLLAFGVISQRVLLPFTMPPLVVHENGYVEICSWQSAGSQKLLFDADGNPVDSAQPVGHCPACSFGNPLFTTNLDVNTPIIATPTFPIGFTTPDIPRFTSLPPAPRAPPATA
ncbi:DUF2946 family protein [Marinospirillum alkaliphilum]|uniref:DUF2946 domain-containing protein n=1 Tax=Marinospirillum alkaliphilum DSM 21637 TaxID=1122209 RepID=A0A1K1UG22_9GAMM|nr:DUF2946 family protein [Marinospirillum alkaliphilum]SFX11301.1 hypothetical protein SAMN02745752_00585 [Marinospirillum alkaliphilum DSM 21637]